MTLRELEQVLNQALKQMQDLTERMNILERRVNAGLSRDGINSTDEDIVRLKRANKDLKHQLTSHYCGSQ